MTTDNINIELDEPEETHFCHFTGVELTDDTLEYEAVIFRNSNAFTWDEDTMSFGYRHTEEYVYYTNEPQDFNQQLVFHCDDCGSMFHYSLYDEDTSRCHGCNENYNNCFTCEEEIHSDYSYYDDDGDSYCGDCWSESERNPENQSSQYNTILNYGHKPSWVMGWVVESQLVRGMRVPREILSEPTFGIELETNARDRSLVNEAAQYLLEQAPDDYLFNKEDGSINAFEIVTHPCTLEAHKLLLPREAISQLSSRYSLSSWSSVNGNGAGLHVHINKKSFAGSSHQYKFQLFHYRNAETMKRFAGRDSSWGSFNKNRYDNYAEICKGNCSQSERRSALNFMNRDTIELRYFRGSLKPETVLGVLEFVHSVHKYTKLLTTKEVANGHLAWGSYKMWLSEQSYEYLPSVMATRCV